MILKDISIKDTIEKAKTLIEQEKNISLSFKAMFELLLLIITLFCNKLGLNRNNSSKPPSNDPNKKRGGKNKKSDKKPGGQNGHSGSRLEKIKTPDQDIEIVRLSV